MNRLAILGAGALGRIIAHYAMIAGYHVIGFFDNYLTVGEEKYGFRVIGCEDNILSFYNEGLFDCLLIGIGYSHMNYRHEAYHKFCTVIPFPTVIHPTVYVDSTCSVGFGTVILPGCTLDMYSKIGDNCFIYTDSHICHDTIIGDSCFIASGVHISGKSKIGDCCFIGIGATIKDYISVTNHSKIGAGAVVIKDIEHPEVFYIGNPAKPLPT